MNCLEKNGLKDILMRVLPHISQYNQVVSNGVWCNACGAHGMGGTEEHKPNCDGVKLYKEIIEALEALGVS